MLKMFLTYFFILTHILRALHFSGNPETDFGWGEK